MAWRWTAQKFVLSAFVLFHVSALSLWMLPQCALKERCISPFRYYILPLGLWQWWAIFAPDPVRENQVLEAEVVDAKGLIHIHEFPRLADLSWWDRIFRYRHPKFTGNMMVDEYKVQRQFTARHVVRQLGLGDEAFPLTVSIYVKITGTPPFGSTDVDTMTPPRIHMVERFEFASIKEIHQ